MNNLRRHNLRSEFLAGDAEPPSLGQFTARDTAAALKVWTKKHPNPFAPRRASQRTKPTAQ
jgi:hypothetical protein